MSLSQNLSSRFREVIFNGTWIANTNYKHQLSDMNWKTADTKINSYNTIAALTRHVHYYIAGLVRVFEGGTLDIKDKFSFDFPPVQSQQEWEEILTRFWNDSERFAVLTEQMPEEQLQAHFTDEKYGTCARNIEAMIEHAYYHLGQISLIKKAIAGK